MYSTTQYEKLLELIVEQGYTFRLFTDPPPQDGGKAVYLRHDIDYSPGIAVEFAKANRRAGATATFCFQLRCQIYNLLSPWTLARVRQIQDLGQKIGLHYVVPSPVPKTFDSLAQMIRADFEIVKQHIPEIEPVFSWPNPSRMPGLIERGLNLEVPGLVNLYGPYFFKEVAYFSDSDIRYSVKEFRRIIRRGHAELQLLFHPFEWVCGGETMIDVISSTWRQIIREREVEVMSNKVYEKHFPQGMPAEILDRFVQSLAEEGLRRNGHSRHRHLSKKR